MSEISWIKLAADVFDNRKIRQIEAMPEGDTIIVIWFKLLTLAGKTNDGGRVYFMEDVPYTEEMLATAFGRPLMTVKLALKVFAQFHMIEFVDDIMCLPGWEKYQSVEGMEKVRELARLRKQRQRAKLKELPDGSNLPNLGENEQMSRDSPVTVTPGHAIDKDIDKEIDIDIYKKESPTEIRKKNKTGARFAPPSVDEVKEYIREKGYSVDAEEFYAHYESNGWIVGKTPMKNWKAAVVTWQKRHEKDKPKPAAQAPAYKRFDDRF